MYSDLYTKWQTADGRHLPHHHSKFGNARSWQTGQSKATVYKYFFLWMPHLQLATRLLETALEQSSWQVSKKIIFYNNIILVLIIAV